MTLGDFSQQASFYARSRPGYPADLVDQLMADAGVQAGDSVVEFGAGTGIFTRLLAERGLSVTAIEPNTEMRRRAEMLPGVRWFDGTFEQTHLPEAGQHWAVAAQAFHWADPARALPEVRRILRPGGTFTVLWNNRANEKSGVLLAVNAIIARHVPEFHHEYRDKDWAKVLTSTGDFHEVDYRAREHVVPMSRQRFLDLWRSNNQLASTAGAERFAVLFEELTRYVEGTGLDSIDVPYLCRAWSARSLDHSGEMGTDHCFR